MKTNINIHNYEEYFLLYSDGELSVEEMAAVESFVNEHPELQTTLDALLQSRLNVNDKIVFENKEFLFKAESAGISLDNYEEYFLLYVDDELTNEQRNETEKFVLQHPALQNDFTLLKQTRLLNETIVFEDKKTLFRKEVTEKPISSIAWKRFAVAASVIGLIFAGWIFYPKKSNVIEPPNTIAKTKPHIENKQSETVVSQPSSAVKQNDLMTESRGKNIITTAHLQENNQTQNIILVSNKETNNPASSDENNYEVTENTRIKASELSVVENRKTIQSLKNVTQLPDENILVKTANVESKNNSIENDKGNDVVYVANFKVNKNKISHFLKRAKSAISFAGSDDSQGIAIANFTISK